jgi:hypothetical protein
MNMIRLTLNLILGMESRKESVLRYRVKIKTKYTVKTEPWIEIRI